MCSTWFLVCLGLELAGCPEPGSIQVPPCQGSEERHDGAGLPAPVGLLTFCFIYIQLQPVHIKTKQWSEQPWVLGSLGSGFGSMPIVGGLAVRRSRTLAPWPWPGCAHFLF